MGKFEKHVNKGETIIIDEEEFILKAAGSDKVAKPYFKLMKAFGSMKQGLSDEESTQQMMAAFTDETSDAVAILIEETLKASYPEEPEDEMKAFAMKHIMTLMPVVIQLYAPADSKNVEDKKKIDTIIKMRTTNAINQEQVQ